MQKWWKESVVYQVYPRSFFDSNGDGIGDLGGILQKLEHFKTLGVDVVWLSPIYRSPNDDNGYDISDYQEINPEFGSLADFERLVAEMHRGGLKLVMDLVVNHTSDEHPWFVEARKSKDNPYRDYYIWRPPSAGAEPNNWASFFGGSAWQLDPATGEYYLHLFSKKQPDLNWENPKVRQEIYAMMHWWLKKGVDGFRMDVINMISKAPGLADAPVSNPGERYQSPGERVMNGPRLVEFLQEMKQEVLCQYDLLTVGETPSITPPLAAEITAEETGSLSMVFQFDHMDIDGSKRHIQPWALTDLKKLLTRWQVGLQGRGWNSNYLNNHDQPRQVSRFGNDRHYRVESAKMLGTLLHMLQGTPYIFQGEEIGQTNVAFESISDYNDIETINIYHELVEEKGQSPAQVLDLLHAKSRDNARTPMQWSAAPQAGFTTGRPWLRVNPNYLTIHVEQALADPDSVFHYYQKLIQLRKSVPAVIYGEYELILAEDEQIYAFTRTLAGAQATERLLVVLNFSAAEPVFELPGQLWAGEARLLLANYPVDPAEKPTRFALRPYEARVYLLKG